MAYDLLTSNEFKFLLEEQTGQDRILYLAEKIRGDTLEFYDLPEALATPTLPSEKKRRARRAVTSDERKARKSRSDIRKKSRYEVKKKIGKDLMPAYHRMMLQMLLLEGYCKKHGIESFHSLREELWDDRSLLQNVLRYWLDEEKMSEFISELWGPGDFEPYYLQQFQRPSLRLAPALMSLKDSAYSDPQIEQQRKELVERLERFMAIIGSRSFHRQMVGVEEPTFIEVPSWLESSFRWMLDDGRERKSSRNWACFEKPLNFRGSTEGSIETSYNLPFVVLDLAQVYGNSMKVNLELIGGFLKWLELPDAQYDSTVRTKLKLVLKRMIEDGYLVETEDGYHLTGRGAALHEFAKSIVLMTTSEMKMEKMGFGPRD